MTKRKSLIGIKSKPKPPTVPHTETIRTVVHDGDVIGGFPEDATIDLEYSYGYDHYPLMTVSYKKLLTQEDIDHINDEYREDLLKYNTWYTKNEKLILEELALREEDAKERAKELKEVLLQKALCDKKKIEAKIKKLEKKIKKV